MALIGALASALIAGCGGSDDSSLSKAEFVKQGNAICDVGEVTKDNDLEAAMRAELRKNPEWQPTRAYEEKLATDVALPPVSKMTEELRALGLPSEDADGASAIVEGYEKAIEEVKENPRSVTVSSEVEDPFNKPGELAEKYGLGVCARI